MSLSFASATALLSVTPITVQVPVYAPANTEAGSGLALPAATKGVSLSGESRLALAFGEDSSLTQDPSAQEPSGPESAQPQTGADGIVLEDQSFEDIPFEDQGVIIVGGDIPDEPGDPLGELNIQSYELTASVDQAVVEPIANAYEETLPEPVRNGLRNFFSNLLEPVNALNYLLQLKPGKAAETLGRFALNSTVGVGGLLDIAKRKPFNLPHRPNGFSNTLGYYGVKPGPFLFLPLVGPTTLRDLVGIGLDQSILPNVVGAPLNTPAYGVPAFTINALESRVRTDDQIKTIRSSDDPYGSLRETYMCRREAEIYALRNKPEPFACEFAATMRAFDAEQAQKQQELQAEAAREQALAEAAAVAAAAEEAKLAARMAPITGEQWAAEPGSLSWHNKQQAFLGTLEFEDGWHWMVGGLRWRWVPGKYNPDGRKPTVDDRVTVHYDGKFIDGKGFDSSYERGRPATFPLRGVIEAWQVAVPQMHVGDVIELVAPADLAYGPQGGGPIPGGATLVFKVELLDIAGR